MVEEGERGVSTRDAIATSLSPFPLLDFPHTTTATNCQIFSELKALVS